MRELYEFRAAPADFDLPDAFDPDRSNRDRAKRAAMGLEAYWGDTDRGEEAETVAKDFLTDLLHWGDGQGIDIEELLSRARSTYEDERQR